MNGYVILVLENWAECEFDFQIEIRFDDEMPRSKFSINHNCVYYGTTHHWSLNAAKSFLRNEYGTRGKTPRYKWGAPTENEAET